MSSSTENTSSNVKVVVRVRPLLDGEEQGDSTSLSISTENPNEIHYCQPLPVHSSREQNEAVTSEGHSLVTNISALDNRDEQKGEREGHAAINLTDNPSLHTASTTEIMALNEKDREVRSVKTYKFHRIFDVNSTQADVSNELLPDMIDSVLKGYHATIFAYGQTGSGKSYTMEGIDYGNLQIKNKISAAVSTIPRAQGLEEYNLQTEEDNTNENTQQNHKESEKEKIANANAYIESLYNSNGEEILNEEENVSEKKENQRTSSSGTFTSTFDKMGITPRAIKALFDRIQELNNNSHIENNVEDIVEEADDDDDNNNGHDYHEEDHEQLEEGKKKKNRLASEKTNSMKIKENSLLDESSESDTEVADTEMHNEQESKQNYQMPTKKARVNNEIKEKTRLVEKWNSQILQNEDETRSQPLSSDEEFESENPTASDDGITGKNKRKDKLSNDNTLKTKEMTAKSKNSFSTLQNGPTKQTRIANIKGGLGEDFSIKVSFLQIYNEQILDLLSPNQIAIGGQQVYGSKACTFKGGLKLRYCPIREFYVPGLTIHTVKSPQEALSYFKLGIQNKFLAAHKVNACSSRSHCLFTIYVERKNINSKLKETSATGCNNSKSTVNNSTASTRSKRKTSNPSKKEESNPMENIMAKLTLVDLAGSERVRQTGATGRLLNESININKSLFVLRQVIQQLAAIETKRKNESSLDNSCDSNLLIEDDEEQGKYDETKGEDKTPGGGGGAEAEEDIETKEEKKSITNLIKSLNLQDKNDTKSRALLSNQNHSSLLSTIPYRDSKLTSLLKASLGGNSITIMIACLSPSSYHHVENLSTLVYASTAQSIVNKPIVNRDAKSNLILKLKEENKKLKTEVSALQKALLVQINKNNTSSNTTCSSFQNEDSFLLGSSGIEDKLSLPSITGQCNSITNTPSNINDTNNNNLKQQNQNLQIQNKNQKDLVRRLKQEVVDSTKLLKFLIEKEKDFQNRLQDTEDSLVRVEEEKERVHEENRSLRDTIEVLQFLVEDSNKKNLNENEITSTNPINYLEGKGDSLHIEGYGETIFPINTLEDDSSFVHEKKGKDQSEGFSEEGAKSKAKNLNEKENKVLVEEIEKIRNSMRRLYQENVALKEELNEKEYIFSSVNENNISNKINTKSLNRQKQRKDPQQYSFRETNLNHDTRPEDGDMDEGSPLDKNLSQFSQHKKSKSFPLSATSSSPTKSLHRRTRNITNHVMEGGDLDKEKGQLPAKKPPIPKNKFTKKNSQIHKSSPPRKGVKREKEKLIGIKPSRIPSSSNSQYHNNNNNNNNYNFDEQNSNRSMSSFPPSWKNEEQISHDMKNTTPLKQNLSVSPLHRSMNNKPDDKLGYRPLDPSAQYIGTDAQNNKTFSDVTGFVPQTIEDSDNNTFPAFNGQFPVSRINSTIYDQGENSTPMNTTSTSFPSMPSFSQFPSSSLTNNVNSQVRNINHTNSNSFQLPVLSMPTPINQTMGAESKGPTIQKSETASFSFGKQPLKSKSGVLSVSDLKSLLNNNNNNND